MLDGLHAVFALLKGRIEQHRDILSRSETKTRYSLIDPLLTALGWDISDPAQVQVEYNTPGAGYADYALFAGQPTPQVVVEAKKLDRQLSGATEQAIAYCVGEAIPYFVVTNGERWIAYDTFKRVQTQEKRVADFSLNDESKPAMMKALWLWRGNFETATPVPRDPIEPAPSPRPAPAPPHPDTLGTSLSALSAQAHGRPPTALAFSDGVVKPIRQWRGLQTAVVEWLTETDRLTAEDCPVVTPNRATIVHVSPTKANGSPFVHPVQVSSLWIDGNHPAPSHLRLAKFILQARGVDPATVLVQT